MRIILCALLLTGCATNTPNLPQLTCPDPLVLPQFTDAQLVELEGLSRDTQLVIMERDSLQVKRRAMLMKKCHQFDER